MDKAKLRANAITLRHLITNRFEKNENILKRALPLIKNYKNVGIYVSINDEVDTHNLINYLFKNCPKLNVYVPRMIGNNLEFVRTRSLAELKLGRFQLLEPLGDEILNDLDLLVVPLLAFDLNGNRIGYGKGYYDKFLSTHHIKTLGLAFDEQLLVNTLSEEYDIPLNMIVTDLNTYHIE